MRVAPNCLEVGLLGPPGVAPHRNELPSLPWAHLLSQVCHAEVTKRQAKARAAERKRRALGTYDIRDMFAAAVSRL